MNPFNLGKLFRCTLRMACAVLMGSFVVVAYGQQAAPVSPDAVVAAKAAKLLDESLTLLATKADDKDTQWYENGVWHFRNHEKHWPVQGGPATAAAVLWKWRAQNVALTDKAQQDRQQWLHKVAVETFDRAISDHLKPEGYFDENVTPATYFFAVELATTTLLLKDSLDDATRTRWREALVKMVDYLIKTSNLPNSAQRGWKATDGFYTNGNIEVGEAELLWLTWKITGEKKYQDLFELQWKHTLSPSPERWKQFGLRLTKEPTREDGAGYLAEDGGKRVGFDADYTHFALTVASRLYAFSRDPRVLRVMNLFINSLLPLTDEKWILDATDGARHSLKFPFYSSGLAVVSRLGGRADLTPKLIGQFDKVIYPTYHGNAVQNWGTPSLYRGYGCDVAVILLADMAAKNGSP